MELRAKIRDGRIADLSLGHIKVVAITVHKAAAWADCQHPAGNAGAGSMKILTGSKKAALAATGLTAGRLCTVSRLLPAPHGR